MKRIGLTQRVDIKSDYGERRDALDQKWYLLLAEMHMIPVPLPNLSPLLAPIMLEELHIDGVIFTGGNSLCHLDRKAQDRAPERDAFELALIAHAEHLSLPIFGICRGMQLINYYFGGKLVKVKGHVATNHQLISINSSIELPTVVNSYHSWTIPDDGLANPLEIVGKDLDGNIEAYIHQTKKIAGITWHPERETEINILDLNFIKSILYD
jgi:gamma-glutamyl-gamma-aminobutyrate hydrolase PuuD